MTDSNFLLSIIIVLIGALGYFGKDRFDKLDRRVDRLEGKIADMWPKVDILWQKATGSSASPFALNDWSKKIFNESGIKNIIDTNKEYLLQQLQERHPRNEYELQEYAEKVVAQLGENKALIPMLQDGAFKTGVNVQTVLFTGAIYFRDLILPTYQFPKQ